MSRKTRRNASKDAAQSNDTPAANRSVFGATGVSGLALGAMAFTQPLFAADPATTPAPAADNTNNNDTNTLQEVVVTGIRASLQKSLDIKQNAIGVEDAISAEDIGQFPDASIGEAVARIPGVTVNRGSINAMASAGAPSATGQVTGVTVRGFGTQFNELLSNGRPIASGNGQNFDFSALGAEYVGEVDVHKTPDFSLSSGAIGASIDVKSPDPFDHAGLQARAFGSATDYQKDGGVTPSFGALLSDTFLDDTVGILIAGDYTDKHIDANHFDIVGWKGAVLNTCQMAGAPACIKDSSGNYTTPNNSSPSWYPQDQAMYLERTDSTRKDGRLALQWRPADNVLITVDDNYSSDREVSDRFQYSTWFGCFPASCTNVSQSSNGTITNFTNSNAPTDFNSFVAQTYIVTNTPGVNVKWDVNDQWKVGFDGSFSESQLNPTRTYSDIDADVGYGPNTAIGTNGYTGGLAVPGGNTLPYWTSVGPNTTAPASGATTSPNYLGLNPYIIGSHVLPIQTQWNTDKVFQFKLDSTFHADQTTVHFGAQFVDDKWNSQEDDTFTNNEWQLWSGYGPASNNYIYYCGANYTDPCANQANPPAGATKVLHGVSLPSGLFTPASVSNFIPGANGANLPQSLLLYNPYAVLNYLVHNAAPNADFSPNAGYTYNGGYPTPVLSTGTYQNVERKNYSPFVTAQQDVPVGDMTLKVNAGLRWQRTDVTIGGLQSPLQSLGLEPGDVTAYQFNLGNPTSAVANNSYHYLLPSLDLNLLVTQQFKVRVDASRTESAPNNLQLIPNTTYTGRVNALTATGNNPKLLPYLSDNYDLGAEWYYADNDYVSVDGFFKHVTQFPVSSVQTITVPGVIDTSTLSANFGHLAQFAETTYVNGLAANVTGVEATWQQMLWYGFGYQVNGTYVHSNANFNPYVTTNNQFALPGIGNSANLIAFYQQNGFQARLALQFQAKQLLQLGQEQNGGLFGNEPTYLDRNTELDFSSSYEVNSHMSVFFEALNLTNQVYKTVGRFDNQVLDEVDYGRSFTVGVRAKL